MMKQVRLKIEESFFLTIGTVYALISGSAMQHLGPNLSLNGEWEGIC
jgi:hypothetical protein